MKKFILLFFSTMLLANSVFSQGKNSSVYDFKNTVNTKETGNSKDILSNAFRASISNILGKNKSFDFSSSLYGIDSTLNVKTRSDTAEVYGKQRVLRSTQINFSLKADSNTNNITDISGGLTIALINKRDITYGDYSDFSKNLNTLFNRFNDIRKRVNKNTLQNNPSLSIDVIQQSWEEFLKTHNYDDLDSKIRAELAKLGPDDEGFIKNNEPKKAYDAITLAYARRPLLSLSPGYNYNRPNKQSSFSLSLAFLVGLTNNIDKKPWELEAKTSLSVGADTSVAAVNYANRPFLFSVGLNKVLREDANKASTMELKGFFQYADQFGTAPFAKDFQRVTFNTTLRINVYKAFWLPLTLSYDLKNSNILGFLSFTANLDK